MSTVDNRIVHMTFDNAQFERNLAQTMKSMEDLKKSLDFSHAKSNFNQLATAANSFHLGGMASAVDSIASKFTALGATAFSVISNITNRVVDAGVRMAKSFTVGPIISGFQEMETNMNSIQTILANTSSKGSTLEDVNVALAQLNEYSDQTIYNFSQMARNIGTFTAAGVDLDTSVGAIKGIANVAAISGSNAEQASNAMYQLSQALASGSVKLMDWNSIVNAGMGGEVFQKALFETGKSLGTLQDVGLDTTFDDWKAAGNTFRNSLEDGWLTADVLTNTLNAFTGDLTMAQLTALGYTEAQAAEMMKLGQLGKDAATEVKTLTQLMGTVKESVGSGWAKTFQIVFGDFEEAKELFTSLSNAIGGFVGRQADARNELLQGWKDLGGRTELIKGLKDGFQALGRVMIAVRGAFREVFPKTTAKELFELTQRFSTFMKNLMPAPGTLDKIREIFVGVFSAVSIGIEIIKGIAGVFKSLFDQLTSSVDGNSILDFFVNISQKVQDLKVALVDQGGIKQFFDNISNFFRDPLTAIDDLVNYVKSAFEEIKSIIFLGDFTGKGPWEEDSPIVASLFKFKDFIADTFGEVGDKIESFVEKVGDIFNINIKVPEGITDFFDSFGQRVDENTTNSLAGGFERLGDRLSTFWDILKKVGEGLTQIGDGIKWIFEQFGDLVGGVGNAAGAIWDFIKNIGPNLQAMFESESFDKFLDFITSLGVLLGGAGIANVSKNGLKIDVTGGALSQLGELFKQMGGKNGLIAEVQKSFGGLTDTMKAMETQIKADALMKIAIAIGVLTASVLVLSMIDPVALAKALTALSFGFGQLIGSMALLNTMGAGPKGSANIAALGAGMIALASAALVLSFAVTNLAKLDWEELGRGLSGVTALLAMIIGVAKLMQGSSASLIAAGIGMIAVATALNILVGAVKLFSLLDWKDLGKGFAAITAGLLIMAGALNLMPASTILIGPGLMAVATALNILAGAMLIFATMSWKEIGKGLVAIAGGLGLIAAAMHLMPATSIITGPALIAVATGLTILGGALKIFATMSWEEIGKAMTVLGSSLLILGLGLELMAGTIVGAVAVGVAAASLLLLGKALKEFAKMSWKDLGKSLAVMAAALAALGIAALALSATGAIGAIFLLGIALTALGAGFALIGLGASLLAEAFQIMAASGTAGIDVLMYALDQLLMRLPDMITQFASGLLDGADLLLAALPGLIDKLSDIIGSLLDMLIANVPKVKTVATEYIKGFLQVITAASPDLMKAGFQLISDFLRELGNHAKDLAASGLKIITEFLKGLKEGAPALITAISEFVTTILQEFAKHSGEYVTAGLAILTAVLKGITDNLDEVIGAVAELIGKFILETGKMYKELAEAGKDALIDFLKGLEEDIVEIAKSVGIMVTNIMDALADEFVAVVDRAARIIIDFMNDLAEVIRKQDDDFSDAVANLGSAIIEGIIVGMLASAPKLFKEVKKLMEKAVKEAGKVWEWFSPSHVMMRMGNDIIEGLIIGLNDNASNLNRTVKGVSKDAVNSFQTALAEASSILDDSTQFNPTITPVLDLTQVQAQAGGLNGILSTNPLTATTSLQAANTLSAEQLQNGSDSAEPTTPAQPTVLQFEQNNYSPEALNTAKVYKQTRNLIVLTKEELKVA